MTLFSKYQRAALLSLRRKALTTREIGTIVGVTKGAGSMLGSLRGRGMLRYDGKGCRPGLGRWSLSDAGEKAVADILAEDAAKQAPN